MSLFKSKEWWCVNLNENELYDSQSLLVSILGKDRYQSILLGNHDGLFRIYGPTSGITDDGNVIGYRPNDMLIEVQFQAPILQMGVGMLVSGCHDKNVAVLHPKLLSVYTVCRRESEGGVNNQVVLEAAYHHQLRHSAYSLTIGPFGGGRGRDFICVMSLDGFLFFYEQEAFAFQICLPDFLLPCPFAYIDKTDCFLFLNSSLFLECYSYENIAVASRDSGGNSKDMLKQWSYNLGEGLLDVRAVGTDPCSIVVLTERNFYGLSDSGKAIFMKRLEFKPMALHAFVTAESKKLILLVATDDHILNVYEGTCLKWAMRIDQVPVAVDRIFLSNLYGGIVLLSENGYLQCIYLGTRPSVYLMPKMGNFDVNLLETETELKRLQMEISERDLGDPVDLDWIAARMSVDTKVLEDASRRMCRVSVEISNQTPLNGIKVAFVVKAPLSATETSVTINCYDKVTVESNVHLTGDGVVSDLSVRACISYVNNSGMPFVLEKQGRLPLSLVLGKTTPAKEAKYKLTVVTNKPVCPLNVIFNEFADGDSSPNVIAFKYLNTDLSVTVLTAKTTQRYRLQSESMEGIGLVLSALVERVKRYFHNFSDLIISYEGTLPLHVYFQLIQEYHNVLLRRNLARDALSRRTNQYRTIQKKVLVNVKDVTPKPISNLSNILKDTYHMISVSIAELEEIERELERMRQSISSQGHLIINLMELMMIDAGDLEYVRAVFVGNLSEADDQGWLEVQLAAASFFLRTTLAKSVRDQQKPADIVLEPVTNLSKVLKSFSAIIDRVTKGTHLLERSEFENDKELLMTVPGERESQVEKNSGCIPEGSKLMDLDIAVVSDVSDMRNKRERRLIKQERVDSLGVIREPNVEEAPDMTSSTKVTAHPLERSLSAGAEDEKKSFDSIEDDDIWDIKMSDLQI